MHPSESRPPMFLRLRRLVPHLLAVAAVVALTRLVPLASLAPDGLLNTDELELTFAALDRFVGAPSNVLIWPAGPLQMLAVPIFAVDFLLSSHFHASPLAFVNYLSDSYREPWHALMLMRLTVVAVSSLCFALLSIPLYRILGNWTHAYLAVLALATVPVLWIHSHAAMLDAFAFGIACAALAIAIHPDLSWRRVAAVGFVAGIAVASKVTVVPFIPFLLAASVQYTREAWWRCVAIFGAALAAGFAVACPYLWTDPVRLAKTVYGNAARAGTPMGLGRALDTAVDVVPLWYWALAAVGLGVCIAGRRYWVAAGGALTTALTILIMARGGVVFPRYLLPVVPVAVTLGAFALAAARERLERAMPDRRHAQWAATALLLAIVGVNVIFYLRELSKELEPMAATAALAAELRGAEDGYRVIVPWEVLRFVAAAASSESLARMAEAVDHAMARRELIADFTGQRGVPRDAVLALPKVFDEEEQALTAAFRVMAYPRSRPGLDLRIWAKPELAPRFGFLTSEQAADELAGGRADAVVLREAPPGWVPVKSYGSKLHLFVREPAP